MKRLLPAMLIFVAHHSYGAEPAPWNDPSCDFEKTDLKLNPEDLVKEYLRRDSDGQFMQTDRWFDQATVCPGHSPGWDGSTVVRSSKIEKVSESNNLAIFKVRYDVLGTHGMTVENGKELFAFQPNSKEETVEFKAVKTPFGWKLDVLMNQHISPKTAIVYSVQGKSLRSQDRAVLEKLTK